VPLFLDQLTRTLEAEEANEAGESMRISGASGGDSLALSEMGVAAAAHGSQLLKLGFSVDQVVHDYGDLCQAITDLAFERDAPFAIDEFRTLNRCLDNAIADAVLAYGSLRDSSRDGDAELHERMGALADSQRVLIERALKALEVLKTGSLGIAGATGAVLEDSLMKLRELTDKALPELRLLTRMTTSPKT
jgi:hypothetical protein